jgi:hypothetical protein
MTDLDGQEREAMEAAFIIARKDLPVLGTSRSPFEAGYMAALTASEKPQGDWAFFICAQGHEFAVAPDSDLGRAKCAICGTVTINRRLVAREDTERQTDETCTCQHPPEGMIGWDRSMVNRECPLHGHEALPERRDPQMEKLVEAVKSIGEDTERPEEEMVWGEGPYERKRPDDPPKMGVNDRVEWYGGGNIGEIVEVQPALYIVKWDGTGRQESVRAQFLRSVRDTER